MNGFYLGDAGAKRPAIFREPGQITKFLREFAGFGWQKCKRSAFIQ
jgi:hypothetical protein